MIHKIAIAVIVIVVASLSIAGCTTGAADHSNYYNTIWTDQVIDKPFYKTTSERGNDLYEAARS